jgi:pimeloyl-ACP methyl ester carboxylesterase
VKHRLVAAAAVLAAGTGCAVFLSAPTPMRSLDYAAAPKGRCLVVFLPGAGDTAETFADHGFVEAVKASGLSVDMVAANATLGYYSKGTVFQRVKADVIDPAKKRGYEKTWVVGISMGGMGTLLTAIHDEGSFDGAYLIAPYLGDEDLIAEISAAGGLAKWDPGQLTQPITEDNYQRHAWGWLKRTVEKGSPSLYLGYGTEDRLGPAAQPLVEALPADHVYRTNGGHDWPPWNLLWAEFLAKSKLATECKGSTEPARDSGSTR